MSTAPRTQALLLLFVPALLLSILPSSLADRESADNELAIHSIFKPEDCAREAKTTDMLTVHYRGTLQSGEEFDSSHQRAEPLRFQLGVGRVIPGWDVGLKGTCAGEKVRLVVPPRFAYGDVAHDKIPAKSTLTFEVEVLKVEDGEKPANMFKEMDLDGDMRLSYLEVASHLQKQLQEAQKHGDAGSLDDPEQRDMVNEIFAQEDRDKDGHISHEEFTGPKHDHDEL